LKYKGLQGSALCFMGDGAVNQGCFYESLNMAGLWNLPVIYIIENNGYSMGTSLARSSVFKSCLAERAEGFGIDWDTVNGESLYEVRAKLQVAIDRAHRESRPTVLEIATYRYYGHSVADAKHKVYRKEDEIERYKKAQLLEERVLNEEQYEAIDDAARQEAEDSVRFAEESPIPSVESITEDVYFEVDRHTAAGRTGRHFFNS
jgi:pyruvate dehydrogenase E1 component alpha subunit